MKTLIVLAIFLSITGCTRWVYTMETPPATDTVSAPSEAAAPTKWKDRKNDGLGWVD